MSREIELKLEVDAGGADRVRGAGPLAGASAVAAQESTYYDTADGALAEAGFSLRVRRSDGKAVQTVKRQRGVAAGLFDRAEWEWDLDGGPAPDLALAAETPVAPWLGAPLVPVLRTVFERRTWPLAGDGSRMSVTFDQGAVAADGRETGLLELELELEEGDPAALFDLAEAIAAEAPLRIGVLSKSERGQRLADGRLGKPAKAEPIALDPDRSVAEGFAAIAHACLRHYRLNEPVLLESPEPVALHQARVAMRRLRSGFALFGGVLRDQHYEGLREELRWFTAQLGDARNLDVFARRLPKPRKRPRAGEESVRAVLAAAREEAYARALDAIRSQRSRALMLGLVRWVEIGAWRRRGKARRPLAAFAAARLDRRWEKVSENGSRLAALEAEPRHRLRIDVKKMRYAAEFLAGLHAEKRVAAARKRFLSGAEGLQEALGELNDAATARELVASLPLATPDQRAFAETLIGREPDEAKCIAAAEKAFAKMAAAAPYWR